MNYYTVYTYKINQAYFIAATRTDLLNPSKSMKQKPAISLFTCDYTGNGRLFVQGRLIKKQALNKTSKNIQNAFKLK